MNKDQLATIIITIFLVAVTMLLIMSAVKAPDPESAAIHALQVQVADDKKQIEELRKSLVYRPDPSQSISVKIDDLSKQLDEKEDKSPYEQMAFYVGTGLTILTFVATVYALFAAIVPLLKFDEKAQIIAKKEVEELNAVLSGRLQLAISVLLRKITWNTKYELRSKTYDFRQDALRAGRRAMDDFSKITGKEYAYLKTFALNNLVFYTTLNAPDPIDEDFARNALGLAAQLRLVTEFETDPDYINTFALAQIVFADFLGDRSKASILEQLAKARALLRRNFEGDRSLSAAQRIETEFLLKNLDDAESKTRAKP